MTQKILSNFGFVLYCMNWSGLVWSGLVWSGLIWFYIISMVTIQRNCMSARYKSYLHTTTLYHRVYNNLFWFFIIFNIHRATLFLCLHHEHVVCVTHVYNSCHHLFHIRQQTSRPSVFVIKYSPEVFFGHLTTV